MDKILKKQIKRVEEKEMKLLSKSENQIIKTKMAPMINKVEKKIPDKLRDTLNIAFYKGFQLIFEKGTKYIDFLYNKDKKELEYDVNNYVLDKAPNKKNLVSFDKQANKSKWVNSAISMAEGSALGILGIGLPDIPLFIAVIMKTIYEAATSYGFDYETEGEKAYILLIICTALTKGDNQREYNRQLEELELQSDNSKIKEIPVKELTKTTAQVLSDGLIIAKFIQGMPVIGVVGGVVNQSIINKIGKFAGIKYKKRYLRKKLQESGI